MNKTPEIARNQPGTPATPVAQQPQRERVWPAVDIYDNDKEVLLLADLPGVRSEDLNVHIENGQLTVGAIRHGAAHGALLAGDARTYEYERAFRLGEGVATDQISAHLKNGVLEVRLPKREALQPRQITVKAG